MKKSICFISMFFFIGKTHALSPGHGIEVRLGNPVGSQIVVSQGSVDLSTGEWRNAMNQSEAQILRDMEKELTQGDSLPQWAFTTGAQDELKKRNNLEYVLPGSTGTLRERWDHTLNSPLFRVWLMHEFNLAIATSAGAGLSLEAQNRTGESLIRRQQELDRAEVDIASGTVIPEIEVIP